jgi:release factor glutamine methyltransferase
MSLSGLARRASSQLVSFADAPSAVRTSVGALVEAMAMELADAAVVDARSEARDLIAAVAGRPRFWPLLEPWAMLDADVVRRVRAAVRRRAAGAPFAYAAGVAAFRYLTLHVDERVLIPRQETEVLVDLVLRAAPRLPQATAADIGTGSGAIALALATEGQVRRVIATDVAADALAVARGNAAAIGVTASVEFRLGSGLAPLQSETLDVLVANPPYIAFDEAPVLPASVRDWEPMHALICGDGGLAITREIISGSPAVLRSGGLMALECDSRRARTVAALVAANGAFRDVAVHPDLTGRDRFVLACRA